MTDIYVTITYRDPHVPAEEGVPVTAAVVDGGFLVLGVPQNAGNYTLRRHIPLDRIFEWSEKTFR